MASTGEVGCLGNDMDETNLTSMLSVGYTIPKKNILLSTRTSKQKVDMLDAARLLHEKVSIYMRQEVLLLLKENDIPSTLVYWPSEDQRTTSS